MTLFAQFSQRNPFIAQWVCRLPLCSATLFKWCGFVLRKHCDLIRRLYLTWPQISVQEDSIRNASAQIPTGSRAVDELVPARQFVTESKTLENWIQGDYWNLLIGNYSLIHIQMFFSSPFVNSGRAVSGWTSGGNLCFLSDWKTAASSKAVDTRRCDTPYLADCEPCGTMPLSTAASEQAPLPPLGERDANCISWLLILWRTEHSHGFTSLSTSSSQVQALFFFLLSLFFLLPKARFWTGKLQKTAKGFKQAWNYRKTDVAKSQLLKWGNGRVFIVTQLYLVKKNDSIVKFLVRSSQCDDTGKISSRQRTDVMEFEPPR